MLHNAAQLDRVSLHYIDYGTEVEVDVDGLDFQLIQIPLAGRTTITIGSRTLSATPRTAVITGGGESLRMRYSAGNPRLMVRIASSLLADRLAVMSHGQIVQLGTPEQVYTEPVDAYVADFLGVSNLMDASVEASGGGAAPRSGSRCHR